MDGVCVRHLAPMLIAVRLRSELNSLDEEIAAEDTEEVCARLASALFVPISVSDAAGSELPCECDNSSQTAWYATRMSSCNVIWLAAHANNLLLLLLLVALCFVGAGTESAKGEGKRGESKVAVDEFGLPVVPSRNLEVQ
jgi:hypothetical protein